MQPAISNKTGTLRKIWARAEECDWIENVMMRMMGNVLISMD